MSAPRMMFWPTGHRYVNAVVVSGLLSRRVFLTDRLLSQYSREEIALVLLHEIAHVQRLHSWIRLLPVLLIVPAMLLVLQCFQAMLLVLACSAVLGIFLGLIFVTCRWTEFDADRQAICLAVQFLGMDEMQARQKFSEVLRRIYEDNKVDRTSWSHPSLRQRLNAL